MNRLSYISILVVVTTIFIHCGTSNNPASPQLSIALWPLAVNNSWSLVVLKYDSLGNAIDSSTTTATVSKDTIINGQQWFIQTVDGVRQAMNANMPDGFWSATTNNDSTISYLAYKYPAHSGDQYSAFIPMGDSTVTIPFEVVSSNVSVSVVSGNYSCYQYQYSNSGNTTNTYICPGVGMVRATNTTTALSGRVYMDMKVELSSYILN